MGGIMFNVDKEKVKKYLYWSACVFFAYIFLVKLGEKGPVLEIDSNSFMQPSKFIRSTYPLYTSFISICRNIFSEKSYLNAIYIIQSMVAIMASSLLSEYLRKYFGLNYLTAFGVFIFSFLPYGYSLPENVVNHHILTEAVAFPLFSVYMLYVFKTFLEKKKSHLIVVGILTFLLVMTRSQLMLLIPVYVILWVIILLQGFYKKIAYTQRKMFWSILVTSLIVCGIGAILLIGKLVELSGSEQFSDAVMGRVLCSIDEDDRMLFEGEEQEIFDLLYEEIEQEGHRYPYFRDGVWKWEDILEATNENTMMYRNKIFDYYSEKGSEKPLEETASSTALIASNLFYHHIDDYIKMSLHLFLQSFVVAIFIHPTAFFTLCYIIAILLYIVAIGMLWYANCKMRINVKYSIPLLLTLLLIFAIVIITNLIFYGLQRYVVYAFGCFYISCLILLIGMFRERIKRKTSVSKL